MTRAVPVGSLTIGGELPLVLLAGPCVVESRDLVFRVAETLARICEERSMPLVFKSSYKKANRTSRTGFSTLGIDEALGILAEVKAQFHLPIVTDIHAPEEAGPASEVADLLQIPAFLCRQTDLLVAAGETGRAVNIKKGQFLAPEDMAHAAEKVESTGNPRVLLTERGTTFGYHDLVVDMRSLVIMRGLGYPVVMDATHAVQIPSQGGVSGGRPAFVPALTRAAVAVGIDALFLETHPDPSQALSDAGSQLALDRLPVLLDAVLALDRVRRTLDGAL